MSRIAVKSLNPKFLDVAIGFDPPLREFFAVAEDVNGDDVWITTRSNGEFFEEVAVLELDRSDPVTKRALYAIMLDLDPGTFFAEEEAE